MRQRLVVFLAVAAVLTAAAPAFAGPRLVRVIWDVGQAQVYYRAEARAKAGPDPFEVPPNACAAREQQFQLLENNSTPILNKGDKVRIYVVNFNPVSHVWSDSASTNEAVPLGTPLPQALLNASLLALISPAKLPSPSITGWMLGAGDKTPPKAPCTRLLEAVSIAVGKLEDAVDEVVKAEFALEADAAGKNFEAEGKAVASLPFADDVWRAFDDAEAWIALYKTLGHDFEVESAWLRADLKEIDRRLDDVRAAQVALDRVVISTHVSVECEESEKALLKRGDTRLTALRDIIGPDSLYADLKAKFKEANTLWTGFQEKLLKQDWTTEAVEVVVKDTIQPATVLRVDGVFTSTDKTSTVRLQRALVLEVAPELPTLVISSGVAFNKFQFKQLQVVKTTATADGSAKDQFVLADDTSIERIVPVWFENIRIVRRSQVGLYGTFGTTPDRNIFKNAIVGGTAYVAKWRTAFTVGKMMVRGYREDDLTPLKAQFSDSAGFVLSSVTASNLPLPKKPRHYSWFFGVTFGIATF